MDNLPPTTVTLREELRRLLFGSNFIVSSRDHGNKRSFSQTALVKGWTNHLFQSERTRFNCGGNAARATHVLRRGGVNWTGWYPIPLQVPRKRGKGLRPNPAAKSRRHTWWQVQSSRAVVWLHGVIPSRLADFLRLLVDAGIVGADTGDRQRGGTFAKHCGYTTRIAEARNLAIPISTTWIGDGRYINRIHCEVRFTPPPKGEVLVELGDLLTKDVLEASRQQEQARRDTRTSNATRSQWQSCEKLLAAWNLRRLEGGGV